jgi:carboxymethylenebutenolidase
MSKAEQDGWNFYLADGGGPLGVVVVPDIYGYDAYHESVGRDLAKEGVTAAVIDIFRGKSATDLESAMKLRESVSKEDVRSGISAGADLIRSRTTATKVGAMGFCMGGGFALQSACDLGLDYCVDYYGMMPEAEDVSKLKGPLLLILASEDTRITPWAFDKLLPAATKHKKRVEVELYPNVRHAFHKPGWEGYNPEAAEDAWGRALLFIGQFR